MRLWTAYDGALATELRAGGASAAGMNSVAFNEDKGFVMGACSDKSIKVWDVHTGRMKFAMTGAPVATARHQYKHAGLMQS